MTTEKSCRRASLRFKEAFQTKTELAYASVDELAQPLKGAGLEHQKARSLHSTFERLTRNFGSVTMEPIRGFSDTDLERYLTSLPGVGKKVARCLMLYSFDRPVFPVDTHCWRVSRRLGWVRSTRKGTWCSSRDMDRLQSKIPLELRFSLHVNMVSLGRDACDAKNPKCSRCVLNRLCPSGLRRLRASKTREH